MPMRIGFGLIIGALLTSLSIAALPLLGLSRPQLAAAAMTMAVLAELGFWLGVALVGRDAWRIARSDGWRRLPSRSLQILRGADPARAAEQRA